ncbi:hypothetical protein Dimus_012577 [Dionaea muscipula]
MPSDNGNSTSTWPSFTFLGLSSCNLTEFPDLLRSQVNLYGLELADNKLRGEMPRWLLDLGKDSLLLLNLSHNSLAGTLEQIPWKNMQQLDLDFNMFEGQLPILPPSTEYFTAQNNRFSGYLPSSLCDLEELTELDLSNNNLVGEIPPCFENFTSKNLIVLDLQSNSIVGILPPIFGQCSLLLSLSLSGNRLEGPVPRSLANCSSLQMIDLGNNRFNDTFPHWLGALPSLKVLILRSNNFYGSLGSSNETGIFSQLQILDLSNNSFNGVLPHDLIQSLKAMITDEESTAYLPKKEATAAYLGYQFDLYYNGTSIPSYLFSVQQTVKGFSRNLEIMVTLNIIDVSSNRLTGDIPESIGDLASLRWLNLSHNNFNGSIPPSLGNIKLIESLDLSFNELAGQIPPRLQNLIFLEVFNVSYNQLVGSIPQGNQFNSFENGSYLGNPWLCGFPLSKKCKEDEAFDLPSPPTGDSDDNSDPHEWEIVMMGYGFGLVVGLVIGYFMFLERTPLWLLKLFFPNRTFRVK